MMRTVLFLLCLSVFHNAVSECDICFLMFAFFSKAHRKIILLLLFLEYVALMNLFSLVFTTIMTENLPQINLYIFLGCAVVEAGIRLGLLVALSRVQDISSINKV